MKIIKDGSNPKHWEGIKRENEWRKGRKKEGKKGINHDLGKKGMSRKELVKKTCDNFPSKNRVPFNFIENYILFVEYNVIFLQNNVFHVAMHSILL